MPARRTLMTGTAPRGHGVRDMAGGKAEMRNLPTLAQTFRNAGYQAYAVGKLHVYPQRDRIGFDDVLLNEEGRTQFGVADDYEQYLTDRGFAGQQFAHGLGNNGYEHRPWHLPEDCHPTTWTTQQMCRIIKRRDPGRPGFWYLSQVHPHPPLAPLREYWDAYADGNIDDPSHGGWAADDDAHPYLVKFLIEARRPRGLSDASIRAVRRAFYALCTHIDHQLRVVIGTLREEGLLDNTVVLFSSDHGDMLGDHGLWAKSLFYEGSANIPMILSAPRVESRVRAGHVDDRLVGLQDVMPTLLDLAGLSVPDTVGGRSMVGEDRRDWLFGEHGEDDRATRMIHDGQYKLIYYPTGNRIQLFDLDTDPYELCDLASSRDHTDTRDRLITLLIRQLHSGDERWADDAALVGLPDRPLQVSPDRDLRGQRGLH